MSLLCRFQRIQWYPLGLAFGVPVDYLKDLNEYSEKECLTEVLKYWLRNHNGQPTWKEIDEVQERFKTYSMQTTDTKTGTEMGIKGREDKDYD